MSTLAPCNVKQIIVHLNLKTSKLGQLKKKNPRILRAEIVIYENIADAAVQCSRRNRLRM